MKKKKKSVTRKTIKKAQIKRPSNVEAEKAVSETGSYELIDSLKYNPLITIGTIIFFVISCITPNISINYLTTGFFSLTSWILDIKIIGTLIGIGGVLFLLSILWYGLLSSGIMIASIIGIFSI